MATLVLHHAWRSSASRRVRLCLEEKGLAYESHAVDLAKMEQHSPEEERAAARGKLVELLDRMEKTLGQTPWLAGAR